MLTRLTHLVEPPLAEIPFDLFERYVLLEQIAKLFRTDQARYRVLDVGGHTAVLWPGFESLAGALIPDASVAVVDAHSTAEIRNYVQGSGVQLPFRDNTFDLVCSLDTLGDIPAGQRPAFLAELLRVTRDGMYVAFPFDSAGNRWAESVIAPERRQFGLPDRDRITTFFSSSPHSWIIFEQGNTDVWLSMMLAYYNLRTRGGDFVRELNRRFNRTYSAQCGCGPAYRAGYLLSKRRSAAEMEAVRASVDQDSHRVELERIEKQISGLQSQREFLARLDGRMRDLEIGLVTNKRAIQAIYDSRIWKALSKAGGLLLRLSGRSPAPLQRTTRAGRDGAVRSPAVPRERDAQSEFVILECDYPGDSGLPVRDVVEIRGWALANSGIERVLIQIEGQPAATASYGIPRLHVPPNYAQLSGAEQSGFRFFWDTTGLPEGPCIIRITAEARSGQTREVMCKVVVDWKTPPDYGLWIARNEPSAEELRQMCLDAAKFANRPRISIATPVYQTATDLLTRCVESVINQTYPDWELCLTDDGSHDPGLSSFLQGYSERDSRIRTVTLEQNYGISVATNAALSLGTGEYVAFLDHDDELAAFALSEVVRAINDNPDADLLYSDEDKIDEQGRRYDVFFKPEWSPDLFRSCNYICHFVVLKRSLLERLGGLDESHSGSQDYDLLLRATGQTSKIKRIPKVLYHWRAVAGSSAKAPEEKPSASMDGQRALASYLAKNAPGACVEEVGASRYRVRYPIVGDPRISILIPTGGHKNVFRAVDEILEKTAYKNYEIVLIDNSPTARVEERAGRLPVKYIDWKGRPFNFAAMNNAAARALVSPYLLFLNDDTSVISSEWLTAMLEHAQRPEVGAVGAQLWYPNNVIQHAGVVMGIFGNCSHAFRGLPGGQPHYFDFPNLIRNCSAVTGACLLVAREKFFEAGAFDEVNLAVAFQDVDLCLNLLELGYRNVYTPYALLYHFESATKTEKDKIPDAAEDAFMKKKWAKYIADDPYYNPSLARRREDFSLVVE